MIRTPPRKRQSHKTQNGVVLIVGGSREFVGAPALAALAALRAGADLSLIAAPEKTAWAISCMTPDVITIKCKGDHLQQRNMKTVMAAAKKADVVCVGNGLSKKSLSFAKSFVKKIKDKLKVVDADALKAVSFADLENCIVTPHEKELEYLFINSKKKFIEFKKQKTNRKKASFLKKELKTFLSKNNVLLLKGPTDLIISKNKTKLNRTGNAGMTVGGTGDILAGMCAGYLAQTGDLFKSADFAAYQTGKIGDQLLKKQGYGFIASDFIPELRGR